MLREMRLSPAVFAPLALVVTSCGLGRGQPGKPRVDDKTPKPALEPSSTVFLLAERASLNEVSAALADLRARGAGCPEFERLGPLVKNAHGPALVNPCGAGATHVHCSETATGYYVPVSVQRETCVWNLWFVARDRALAPVHGTEDYEEFDLQFTTNFVLDDFQGKGVQEAVVTRGFEHPEGVASGTQVVRHLPDGSILRTHFDAMRDVDGDGLLDGVMSFATELSAICDAHDDPWARISRGAPRLLFHRLPNRSFTLNDSVAIAERAKACKDSQGPVVTLKGGRVSEQETARRAVCQVARGRSRKEVWGEIEQRCRTALDSTHDCPKPRPFACDLPVYLPGWLERVELGAGM